jgi:hypothetical protein
MPGRDGRGPQSAGAGTGGRRSSCFEGAGSTGVGQQRGAGQGFAPRGGGRGRTFGAGRGPGFGAQPQAEDSAQALKNRAAVLERELDDVRRRMKDDAGNKG